MPFLDTQTQIICEKYPISKYLLEKDVGLVQKGQKRWLCSCPLGTHSDSTPSFNVIMLDDGYEIFKCFGCGVGGNIIKIMSLLEKKSFEEIKKALASGVGIELTKQQEKIGEIAPEEIDRSLCVEQAFLEKMSSMSTAFLKCNPTQDAVNKISLLYKVIDELMIIGDKENLRELYVNLSKTIEGYKTIHGHK